MSDYYFRLKQSPSARSKINEAFLKWKESLSVFSPGIAWSDAEIKTRYPEEWEVYSVLMNVEMRAIYDTLITGRDQEEKKKEPQI